MTDWKLAPTLHKSRVCSTRVFGVVYAFEGAVISHVYRSTVSREYISDPDWISDF